MQVTLRLKGTWKVIAFFAVVLPCVGFFAWKAFRYIRYEAIIYWKTNSVFRYKFDSQDSSQKGYLLLTPSLPNNLTYGKLVIVDLQGHLLLERPVNGMVSDFRQWKLEGKTLYSYLVYDSSACQLLAQSGAARHVVILDSALHELRQVHLMPYRDVVIDQKQDLDHHDFIMLAPDHYFTMAAYPRTVDNIPACLPQSPAVKVAAPIIQEVSHDSVVWQWDGSRFPELYLNSDMGNKFYDTTRVQDYAHMNSFFSDPRDSNLIISFHNLNQVVKVSHKTGEILWRLGGRNSDFPLTADQVFLRQHHPTILADGTLMIFDNGEKPARSSSRVLEFKLDEQRKTVLSFRSYIIPEPLAGSRGSVQKVGDDYVICGGAANYVLIVNAVTGAKKLELKASQPFYRAYLVNSITGIPLDSKSKK